MMKIASIAALGFVAAADVPVFSSNDDYDEINLNIRLLAAHNATGAQNATFKVTGSMSSKYTTLQVFTSLCMSVRAPTEAALMSSTGSSTSEITNCGVPGLTPGIAASRRALAASEVAITQVYALGFTSAAAASTATELVNGAGFATTFQTALNTALTSAGVSLTASVDTFTGVAVVAAAATTEAPVAVAAPAAPAATTSDASMVKATTAIAAAVFASLF